jgi:hypothetical protein
MVELRVYNNGTQYWLDLYEESPIKINLSVEDITSADATSAFTRTFRVPGTAHNDSFFKSAYYVDSIDYDVTVKKPAELLIDGEPFREGHIRLQKIYKNQDLDRNDYEIVFLGETRDFASVLGDSPMCQLDLDLVHSLNYDNVVESWQAYPEGNLTDGLFNGDVVYPLIDFGREPGKPEIKNTGLRFTLAGNGIEPDRFKPMIRAKALLDGIFASTGYTYESEFLESNLFKKMYVSAFGNDSSAVTELGQSVNLFEAQQGILIQATSLEVVPCNIEITDPGNNYNNTSTPLLEQYSYTAPLDGAYTFDASAAVSVRADIGTTAYATAVLLKNGSTIYTGSSGTNTVSLNTTVTLTTGDVIQFAVDFSSATDQGSISNGVFKCTSAVGNLDPIALLDCEYKQIDFVKDMLTSFRLVMAPKKGAPTTFIIEPWVEYIATGDIYDWSQKLDRSKDVQLEPLFFTQSDRIEFKMTEDEDLINNYNQTAYKEVYGQLNFDSGSELLKGTREVTTNFSPTPLGLLDGLSAFQGNDTWVIPKLYSGDAQYSEPIRPNTRFLFYNGLQSASVNWFMLDGTTEVEYPNYPLVSYHETWPPSINDLQLNWNIQFAYYGDDIPGVNGLLGQSLFERYWAPYIESLYNKFSRRLTGYFVLDSKDLIDFSFDDIIFVDGTYYRPEKIVDAPVGLEDKVKVQLIKLNNFKPSDLTTPSQFYYYEARIDTCASLSTTLYILQSSSPLDNGDVVSVVGSSDCFRIMNPASTNIYDFVVNAEFATCQDCLDNATTEYIYRVNRYTAECGIESTELIVTHTSTLNIGDTVDLASNRGCWYIAGISQLTPTDSVANVYVDCAECQGVAPDIVYAAQYCDGSGTVFVSSTIQYNGGDVVRITDACNSCVTITDFGPYTAEYGIIDQVYIDCESCNNQTFGQEPMEFDDNCREFDGV